MIDRNDPKMKNSGYFEKVYEIVRLVPAGRVTTYGRIAAMTGYPARSQVVGWALHCNPYQGDVPCHRIVDRNGRLSESYVFGGVGVQRDLLEKEGICFNEEGRIDLDKYQWK